MKRLGTLMFAMCTILGTAHVANACSPYGLIGGKWNQIGGAHSVVGNCVNDESDDGVGGRIQTFANGFISWDGHSSQAYYLEGQLATKWTALGGARFGRPTQDALTAPDGFGRYVWLSSTTGGVSTIYFDPHSYYCSVGYCNAYVMYGAILTEWSSNGYERGQQGYPESDEAAYTAFGGRAGERISTFDNGFIRWRPDGSILDKLENGRCIKETGSYLVDQQNGIDWCY